MEENNQRQQIEEIEINLFEMVGVVWSRLGIIILTGILVALAVFLISVYLIVPQYESTTKLYVISRQNSETLTYSDLQSGTQLTKDYKELVISRPVLEIVINELGLEIDNEKLEKMITVESPTDTRILTINVEDSDPYVAREIADTLRQAATEHISNVMDIEAVNVVEEANLPLEPSSPNILLNIVIGSFAGLFCASAVVIVLYMLDDTIKNPDDVESSLNCSLLASIPVSEMEVSENKKIKKKKQSVRQREDAKKKEEKSRK